MDGSETSKKITEGNNANSEKSLDINMRESTLCEKVLNQEKIIKYLKLYIAELQNEKQYYVQRLKEIKKENIVLKKHNALIKSDTTFTKNEGIEISFKKHSILWDTVPEKYTAHQEMNSRVLTPIVKSPKITCPTLSPHATNSITSGGIQKKEHVLKLLDVFKDCVEEAKKCWATKKLVKLEKL